MTNKLRTYSQCKRLHIVSANKYNEAAILLYVYYRGSSEVNAQDQEY